MYPSIWCKPSTTLAKVFCTSFWGETTSLGSSVVLKLITSKGGLLQNTVAWESLCSFQGLYSFRRIKSASAWRFWKICLNWVWQKMAAANRWGKDEINNKPSNLVGFVWFFSKNLGLEIGHTKRCTAYRVSIFCSGLFNSFGNHTTTIELLYRSYH